MWAVALWTMPLAELGVVAQLAALSYLTAEGGIDMIVAHENWQIATDIVWMIRSYRMTLTR